MITGRQYLRAQQGDHSLILLTQGEFSAFLQKGALPLPPRHYEHFARVLRRPGSWKAIIGDGQGKLVEGEISKGEMRLGDNQGSATYVCERHESPVSIAQAWIKPKGLALVLQKCAELGVDEIVLFDSEYSAPHAEKPQRIEAILENACMQAYNPVKPAVRLAAGIHEVVQANIRAYFGDPLATGWLEPGTGIAAGSLFICGPEGGFSAPETISLRAIATGVLISENVLRAETAAIIAAGILCLRK